MYVFFVECQCSMWLRSGTSETWHWKWDLLCLYQDLKLRLNRRKKCLYNAQWNPNDQSYTTRAVFSMYVGAGVGWSRSCWSGEEACDWSGCWCPANLLGSGMWLRGYFSESAKESASGEICGPSLWFRLKYLRNYWMEFHSLVETFMAPRGKKLTDFGGLFGYSEKYLNIIEIHWHHIVYRHSRSPDGVSQWHYSYSLLFV